MNSVEERRAIAREVCTALEMRTVGDSTVLSLANKLRELAEDTSKTTADFKKGLEKLRDHLAAGKQSNPSFKLLLSCCPVLEDDRPEAYRLWPAAAKVGV